MCCDVMEENWRDFLCEKMFEGKFIKSFFFGFLKEIF
jgi:hypothetical protein